MVNKSIAYFEAEMKIAFKNKTTKIIPLTIENCEFGKILTVNIRIH